MFTNEEALRLIKECDGCFVVWATDQNAVVAVHPIPAGEDLFKALAAMSTDYSGPTKGRYFKSEDVTLQTLQDEQAETTRVATRVAIFNSWLNCGIGELIDIVVEGRFHEPMDFFHGSSHIIARLYKIHGPQLTGEHLARLEQFAQAPSLSSDHKCVQKKLQCYLAVLQNDPDRLKAFWKRHYNPNIDWSTWDALTDAAGDLPTQDQDIIAQLIEIVETLQFVVATECRKQSAFALGQRKEGDDVRFRNYGRVAAEANDLGFGHPTFRHSLILPFARVGKRPCVLK